MYYGNMRGHEYAAVFARRRIAKDMIVLIQRAAYGAETVMTVSKRVRNGKFLQAAGPCRLNNAHIGYIMRGKRVKFQLKLRHIPRRIMGRKYLISHSALISAVISINVIF